MTDDELVDAFDRWLHDIDGDSAWNAGYMFGAAAALGLLLMALAIRDTYCDVCRECGYVAHNEPRCQCWNDE